MSSPIEVVRAEIDDSPAMMGPKVRLSVRMKPETLNVSLDIHDTLYRLSIMDYAYMGYRPTSKHQLDEGLKRKCVDMVIEQMVKFFEKELRQALEAEAARKNPRSLYDAFS